MVFTKYLGSVENLFAWKKPKVRLKFATNIIKRIPQNRHTASRSQCNFCRSRPVSLNVIWFNYSSVS